MRNQTFETFVIIVLVHIYKHRRTRRGGWGGCSPLNFERNYHFRAIPIEIFGQFVGLSINFRSSK